MNTCIGDDDMRGREKEWERAKLRENRQNCCEAIMLPQNHRYQFLSKHCLKNCVSGIIALSSKFSQKTNKSKNHFVGYATKKNKKFKRHRI